MEKVLMSVPEIARAMGCSERFVWQEIKQGKLSRTKLGRLVKVSAKEVERYIQARTQPDFDAKKIAADTLRKGAAHR